MPTDPGIIFTPTLVQDDPKDHCESCRRSLIDTVYTQMNMEIVYITLHDIILHYITSHYITVHYINIHTYIHTLHTRNIPSPQYQISTCHGPRSICGFIPYIHRVPRGCWATPKASNLRQLRPRLKLVVSRGPSNPHVQGSWNSP